MNRRIDRLIYSIASVFSAYLFFVEIALKQNKSRKAAL